MTKWFRSLRNQVSKLWRTEYVSNLRITGVGVGMTSILGLLTSPILSRIFEPEVYGTLGLYTNTLANLHLLIGLILPVAIVVEHNHFRLYKLIGAIKFMVLAGSLAILFLVAILGSQVQILFNDTTNGFWLWFLPLGLVFGKIGEVASFLNVRAKEFRVNTKVNILSSLVNRLGSITGGLLKPTGEILITASLLTVFPTIIAQKREHIRQVMRIPARWMFVKQSLKYYRKYPLYMFPASLLSTLGISAPFFLFISLESPAVAGAYLLADNTILFPYRLAERTFRPVYLQKITTVWGQDHDKFQRITEHTNWSLFLLGVVPYSLLTVYGVEIFGFVFGDNWKTSGLIVEYMAFFVLFRMSISPLSGIYQVLKLEQYTLWMQLVLFVCRVVPLAVGLYFFTLEWALLLFATGSLVGYLIYYYQLTRVSKLPFWGSVLKQLALFFLVIFVFWWLGSL